MSFVAMNLGCGDQAKSDSDVLETTRGAEESLAAIIWPYMSLGVAAEDVVGADCADEEAAMASARTESTADNLNEASPAANQSRWVQYPDEWRASRLDLI